MQDHADTQSVAPLRIGVAGLGNVGATLVRIIQKDGEELTRKLGRKIVVTAVCARSRSREETFERDLTDRSEILAHVTRLAREVTDSVVADGRRVTHVAIKVRTATFWTRSKISKLPIPTTDPREVERVAALVLDRFELTRPIRLLGVRAEMVPPEGGYAR